MTRQGPLSLSSSSATPVSPITAPILSFAARREGLIEEGGTVGFWSTDLRTAAFEGSAGCMRILGVTGERSPHCLIHATMHPDDRAAHSDVDALMRSGLGIVRQFRILRSDRTVRRVRVRAEVSVDQDNRPARADGIICDITEIDVVRAVSADSQECDRNLIEVTACIVWQASPDGHVVGSENWTSLTGQALAEQRGEGWIAAVHPDDRERVTAEWRNGLARRARIDMEFRILCRDGASRWHRCRLIPLFSGDGSIREWFGGLTEIRERIDPPVVPAQAAPDHLSGNMVRATRGALNWTIADLAEASRLSASTIKRLVERGSAPLRKETGRIVCRAFEANGVAFMVSGSGETYIRI